MITVKGSVVGNVSAAKQQILENLLGTTILDLDEIFVERIIGGEKVRRLEMEYGVLIHFEQKNQDGNDRQNVYILRE